MLLRFDPFREMDRLLQVAAGPATAATAMLDAFERDGMLHLIIDLPGVAEDDVEVSVDGQHLIVRAERRYSPDPGDKVLVAERPWGESERRLRLDSRWDVEKVTASLDRGVLTITVASRQGEAGPRRIALQPADLVVGNAVDEAEQPA